MIILQATQDIRKVSLWLGHATLTTTAGKTKLMTLDAEEFTRRFLLHALPDGFHRIRHYGFLANGQRGDNLALCRRLLDAHHAAADSGLATGHAKNGQQSNACDFLICPDCGGTMRRTHRRHAGVRHGMAVPSSMDSPKRVTRADDHEMKLILAGDPAGPSRRRHGPRPT